MQGLGYVTTEQMLRSRETGEMLSTGPGNYKVIWEHTNQVSFESERPFKAIIILI